MARRAASSGQDTDCGSSCTANRTGCFRCTAHSVPPWTGGEFLVGSWLSWVTACRPGVLPRHWQD
jgi:hypothetical protein